MRRFWNFLKVLPILYRRVNVYFGGRVISIKFTLADGAAATAGIILRGEYDFGKAVHEENILITWGTAIINGRLYKTGESLIIEPSGRIHFTVRAAALTYLCIYH